MEAILWPLSMLDLEVISIYKALSEGLLSAQLHFIWVKVIHLSALAHSADSQCQKLQNEVIGNGSKQWVATHNGPGCLGRGGRLSGHVAATSLTRTLKPGSHQQGNHLVDQQLGRLRQRTAAGPRLA